MWLQEDGGAKCKQTLMRLSIIRVLVGRSAVGQQMFAAGMCSCAIAVHFLPCGFARPFARHFAFGLPHPPTSWFMVGPGVQVSILFLHWESQCDRCHEEVTCGRLPWLPPFICFLSTLAHCLLCCQLGPTLHFEYCLNDKFIDPIALEHRWLKLSYYFFIMGTFSLWNVT